MSMAAAAAKPSPTISRTSVASQKAPPPRLAPALRFPSYHPSPFPNHPSSILAASSRIALPPPPPPRAALSSSSSSPSSPTLFHGLASSSRQHRHRPNHPAEHLTLVPSNPDEYAKLGSHAFCGLPSPRTPSLRRPRRRRQPLPVVVAAPTSAALLPRARPRRARRRGVGAVVAESYARIFFRNSVATGEVYPLEVETEGLHEECTTGDVVTVDLEKSVLINHTTGREYRLKPIGDAGPVIEAGGIFAYARKTGMIASASTA
ncbi:3-isopropylmalate dehydratase small subunit 3 [Ananas comosus]|uniref:3-isopropylmalate dehydratase small subunit 3 n=1 Tax=Ananas comosus TaxID=4615 RepID=A0A199UDD6_ANACO|nr:3-isopropylmalate dehydratase small subunit 3 [Ananas comosus]